jgi:hypothetical protein
MDHNSHCNVTEHSRWDTGQHKRHRRSRSGRRGASPVNYQFPGRIANPTQLDSAHVHVIPTFGSTFRGLPLPESSRQPAKAPDLGQLSVVRADQRSVDRSPEQASPAVRA